MIVQIYETTTPGEARQLAELGVDHVGVLVGTGDFPREVDPTRAREIFAAVPAAAKRVALSLADDVQAVAEIVAATEPDAVHLGTTPEGLSPADVRRLKREFPRLPVMRTIPVVDEGCVDLARGYDGVADWLLLDTVAPGAPVIGATGLTHDWALSRRIVETVRIPVILAGGLGPDNVRAAIRRVRPAGVDSKTLTDRHDGRGKDLDLVRAFVAGARAA